MLLSIRTVETAARICAPATNSMDVFFLLPIIGSEKVGVDRGRPWLLFSVVKMSQGIGSHVNKQCISLSHSWVIFVESNRFFSSASSHQRIHKIFSSHDQNKGFEHRMPACPSTFRSSHPDIQLDVDNNSFESIVDERFLAVRSNEKVNTSGHERNLRNAIRLRSLRQSCRTSFASERNR